VASLSDHPPLVDHHVVELTVENGPKVGADVLRTLDAAQIPIGGLALREPSLDDVFLSLTGHKSEAETDEERAARTTKSAKRRASQAETDGRDAA
jgi:ABC-2 type transport system ATP-binding protein